MKKATKKWALLAGLLLLTAGRNRAWAVDGISVSIAYRYSEQCKYCPANDRTVPERNVYNGTFWGYLVRYDVQNSEVVSVDTLLDYLAYYPAISIDGTRIALFLRGAKIDENNDMQEGVIDPGIYVCDIDGGNLHKVLDYSRFGNLQSFLDWPQGDWVYYNNRTDGEGEIWRVNVTDGTNERVLDYIPPAVEVDRSEFRRWSCNAAGTYAVTHIANAGARDSKNAHCFPPPGEDPSVCNSGTIKDCNQSMGASGHYMGSYYGVGHDFIDLYSWDFVPGHAEKFARITVGQAATWAGKESVGKGGEWIRWSCNSDKWVLQQLGWAGHANNLDRMGSNAVYIDWVDSQAIMISNNVKNSDAGVNSISYCNTSGDFWVRPPSGKEGFIQQQDGTWIPVPQTSAGITTSATGGMRSVDKIMMRNNRLLLPTSFDGIEATASIYRLDGALVLRRTGLVDGAGLDLQPLGDGTYLIAVTGARKRLIDRITLSR